MNQTKEIRNYLFEFSEYLDKKIADKATIKSGYENLDRIIGGFFRGKVYTVGARTGKGKTTFLTNIAFNNSASAKILFFSTEISTSEFAERLISLYGNIPVFDFHTKVNYLYDDLILNKLDLLLQSKIFVNDTPRPALWQIEKEIGSIRPDFVILDYLGQLFYKRDDNVPKAVADMMCGIKVASRKFDIPVLVAAQLNRQVEYRGGTPILSDLKESGGIEETSDLVMLINELGEDFMEIAVAKSRYSGTGLVREHFSKSTLKLSDEATRKYNLI